MKIAMMTNNYKPFIGGVPISVERLSEGLRLLGHDVTVFAPEYTEYGQDEDEDAQAAGITDDQNVIRCRTYGRKLKNGMVIPDVSDKRIREEFEQERFDLIHVHQPMLMGNIGLHLSKKYDIPIVFTYHTRYEEYLHYLKFFEKCRNGGCVRSFLYEKGRRIVPHYILSYASRCDLVFAPSADMQHYTRSSGLQVPVHILPTGLDEVSFAETHAEKENSRKIRERCSRGRRYLLCTVSRLEKEKNLYFLLDAVKKLKEISGDIFRLMIVGDGAEREGLEEYVKKLGIQETVCFTGLVENKKVKEYLFASDLFLFASTSETQGIVLAEAMAAGVPAVAVASCGVNDIVKHNENGILCEEDRDLFAENTGELLNHSEELSRLKKGAEKTAQNYRAQHIAKLAQEGYLQATERRESSVRMEKYQKNCAVSSFLRLFKVS